VSVFVGSAESEALAGNYGGVIKARFHCATAGIRSRAEESVDGVVSGLGFAGYFVCQTYRGCPLFWRMGLRYQRWSAAGGVGAGRRSALDEQVGRRRRSLVG